jgi:predicted nuclease of predicted toxin-antitoxin system
VKIKLDENLGGIAEGLFRASGHDVESVRSEGLSGASDEKVYATCRAESRCLVTLDLDFSDPLRFPAEACEGIVILRAAGRMTWPVLASLIRQCLQALESMPLNRELWIVEPGRVRVRQFSSDNEP